MPLKLRQRIPREASRHQSTEQNERALSTGERLGQQSSVLLDARWLGSVGRGQTARHPAARLQGEAVDPRALHVEAYFNHDWPRVGTPPRLNQGKKLVATDRLREQGVSHRDGFGQGSSIDLLNPALSERSHEQVGRFYLTGDHEQLAALHIASGNRGDDIRQAWAGRH